MSDVSCNKIVRLKNHVDYDYLSANFYVWEGTYGRIAETYIYNSTSRGISPAHSPGSRHVFKLIEYSTCRKHCPLVVLFCGCLYGRSTHSTFAFLQL